jgi:DNA-directed RNA polymerase specialized sigma24 family protein
MFAGSFWVPEPQSTTVASAGAVVLFATVLLPVLTDFEIDVLGIRAKAGLATRRQRIQAACLQEKHQLSALVAMVGVEPAQVASLVEEAAEETGRLWRGRVDDELVRQLLICRAVQLIRIAADIGAPYRMADFEAYGRDGAAFAALDSSQRVMVALVMHHEMNKADVAAMLDVDVAQVEDALGRLPSRSGMARRSG